MAETTAFKGLDMRRGGTAALTGVALALSACGAEKTSDDVLPTRPAAYEMPSTANPKLVFDDLRPGHHGVQVFQSPSTTRYDRVTQEYFREGDHVEVACHSLGRFVRSRPSRGERKRSSKEWYKLHTTTKKDWVSAIYVKNLRELRADPRIKDC